MRTRPGLIPSDPRLDLVVEAVERGERVVDWAFDGIYPDALGLLSATHWTPLQVARRAAALLVSDASTCVLDVGSGVGKFCAIGALTTAGHFTGIEQRGPLVQVASAISSRYNIHRAQFIQGDIREVDWSRFDAFYFFNSFGENQLGLAEHIDETVELSQSRFERDLAFAISRLQRSRIGTRVVTYYGLGDRLPNSYEPRIAERIGDGVLELWVKVRP